LGKAYTYLRLKMEDADASVAFDEGRLRGDVENEEKEPWRRLIRNANRPRPPDYAAPEAFLVPPLPPQVPPPLSPRGVSLPSAPPPLSPRGFSSPLGPPQPAPPIAGERMLQRPPDLFTLLGQHVQWDAIQNDLLRQDAPVGSRVLVPPAPFVPVAPPKLTPLVDPKAIEQQIEQIKAAYPQVNWSLDEIKARRAFLGRFEEQRKAACARFAKQIRDWSRQKDEYASLREYDDAVENLTKDLEHAKKMLGAGVGRKRSRSTGDNMEL